MCKYILMSIFVFVILGNSTQAQTLDESVLFSLDNQAQSSARAMATGNAFGALGADAASFGINPAGLGFYRNNEFTFTTQFANTYQTGSLYGTNASDNDLRFQIPNISYVRSKRVQNDNFKFLNWGIAYNKRKSLRSDRLINSTNNESSVVDFYRTRANNLQLPASDYDAQNIANLPSDALPAYLAYQTYLIDPIENNQYSSVVNGGRVQQKEAQEIKGSIDDLMFSFGANYNDKIYFGGTLGIPFYTYASETILTETDPNNNHERFNSLWVAESVDINGAGFFAKAGIVVRPIEWLRVGASLHSPEWIGLVATQIDSIYTEVSIDNADFEQYATAIEYEGFNYRLKTAPKLTLSAATFIKRSGFISLDVDFVGYNALKYNNALVSDGNYSEFFTAINTELKDDLNSTINVRLGGELAIDKFRIMGGYGFYGSPYANKNSFSGTNILSAGFGTRLKKFSFDIALQQAFYQYDYRLYNLDTSSPIANINNSRTKLSTTFGFRF